MKKPTQEQRIIKKLLADGYVTRNEALRNFISRLGAIVCDLEAKGWEFEAKYTDDKKDYIYKVVRCPLQKSVYKIGEKEIITYR